MTAKALRGRGGVACRKPSDNIGDEALHRLFGVGLIRKDTVGVDLTRWRQHTQKGETRAKAIRLKAEGFRPGEWK